MRSTEASVLCEPRAEADRYLPEGPREAVLLGARRLVWVNIQDGPGSRRGWVCNRTDGGTGAVAAPGRPGFALPATGDRLLVGMDKGLRAFTFGPGTFSEPLATVP